MVVAGSAENSIAQVGMFAAGVSSEATATSA
jgi:hypothetical protein